MLLAIDIGNTNITWGLFKDNRLIKRDSIPTQTGQNLAQLKRIIAQNKIENALICSVVPAVTAVLNKNLKALLQKSPYLIGKDIKVPIKNLYRQPQQVGQDRLVNAYAAVKLYGAPLIVVDFGTAITFDIVSKNKEYLGGMILPGLQLCLEALAEKTALLPKLKLKPPKEFIGRDTRNSMQSGIVYGFSGLTDSLIVKIKDKIGTEAKVIGTGGNIGLIGRFCREIKKRDKNLTLKGLNLLFKRKIPS